MSLTCEIRHTLRPTQDVLQHEWVSMPAPQLNATELRNVVRQAPLVSIDLVVRDANNRVLLGLRTNEPAKGSYFVPDGRILKDERLNNAFARILKAETSFVIPIAESHFIGVYEHFYETDFLNETWLWHTLCRAGL